MSDDLADQAVDAAPHGPETDAERARRLAHEAPLIERGLADIAAGRTISIEAVRRWVDSIGTDHELPAPTAE